jgi:hypothetical protein
MMGGMKLKFCPVCGDFDVRRAKKHVLREPASLVTVYRCNSGHLFVFATRGRKPIRLPYVDAVTTTS